MSAWLFPAFVPCNYAIHLSSGEGRSVLPRTSVKTQLRNYKHMTPLRPASRRKPTGYHGARKVIIFMCLCCCWEYSGPHNEYYHISPSLHLSRIIMLPSRTWRSIKGKCVIWHPCQRITTSEAAPRWKSLVPLVPKTIFNDFPKRQGGLESLRPPPFPPLIF